MKKPFLLTLNEDNVAELKIWLDKNGQTFSGYVDLLINENLDVLRRFTPKDKKTNIGIFTLIGMAGKMHKELQEEIKKK